MGSNETPMRGKVCMVTGATSGIGFCAALEIARMGAGVTLASRNPIRCEKASRLIRKETGNSDVEPLALDLSDMASVRHAAGEFLSRHDRLHVLVNNAGALYGQRRVTPDGLEMTLAVNHLGHFLLTNLLLDRMMASAPARIINVSSAAHYRGHIRFNDLQMERHYGGLTAYDQAKLANVLFTYELARRLQGTGVTANVMNPGLVRTRFGREDAGWFGVAKRVLDRLVGVSPVKGAETIVYLATSPEVEGITGKYWRHRRPERSSRESYSEVEARRLWDVSAELCGQSVKAAAAAASEP